MECRDQNELRLPTDPKRKREQEGLKGSARATQLTYSQVIKLNYERTKNKHNYFETKNPAEAGFEFDNQALFALA